MRAGVAYKDTIVLSPDLQECFVATVKGRLPLKSFGYFLSATGPQGQPSDFVLFEDNIRNSLNWKGKFEAYGRYFVDHDDAGFVATPEEAWRVQKEIWTRGLVEVGVFHSHLRHPANFSQIDYEMHTARFSNLWHITVSMRNPDQPQLRAFAVSQSGVRELRVAPVATRVGSMSSQISTERSTLDQVVRRARESLRLDDDGYPMCHDSQEIFTAVSDLLRMGHSEAIEDFLVNGFFRDAVSRYDLHVAADMCLVQSTTYTMGTLVDQRHHFCGETPNHQVKLLPFHIGRVPVTNEMFAHFDQRRLNVPFSERKHPVVGVSWFDAAVYSMWMGCRLVTEAEWEFACGAGSEDEWCCSDESMLRRHAWYSENSAGQLHAVGTRRANSLGLFDMHGSVWEWCQDHYDQDFYSCSPIDNPVNSSDPNANRVCRGGSIHALSEMCRTRYRFHEPPSFFASDLGFRLARTASSDFN